MYIPTTTHVYIHERPTETVAIVTKPHPPESVVCQELSLHQVGLCIGPLVRPLDHRNVLHDGTLPCHLVLLQTLEPDIILWGRGRQGEKEGRRAGEGEREGEEGGEGGRESDAID